MNPKIHIFFEVFADRQNVNAQSLNARGIALRLNPERFRCSFVVSGEPDPNLLGRSQIKLIVLPPRLKSSYFRMCLLCSPANLLVYPSVLFHTPFFSRFLKRGLRRKKIIFPLEAPLDYLKDENPELWRQTSRMLRESDSVVPISAYTARILKQETGIESPTIIPLGIDTRFFYPKERKSESPVRVVFAGRLIARKGVERVVDAAARFPGVSFSIVGAAYGKDDGLFARKLQQRVREEGLSNIEFQGTLSQEQFRRILWEADILLHPSCVEGIPRVTLEAGSTGLPSIVFDVYQTPSVIDGVTGFQVGTFDQMMDRLQRLIENRNLRRRMGAAAVEHVRQFDWELLAPKWEQVFTRMAAS
jgi:glycosyltransferase involved in cell wall biosynthesis